MNCGTFGEYRTGIGKEILWEKTFRKSWHKVFIHTEMFMILIQIYKTLSPLIRRLVPRYRCANRNRNSCADSEMIAKPFLRCLRTAPTPSRVRHRFLIFTASSSYVRILCHGKEARKMIINQTLTNIEFSLMIGQFEWCSVKCETYDNLWR